MWVQAFVRRGAPLAWGGLRRSTPTICRPLAVADFQRTFLYNAWGKFTQGQKEELKEKKTAEEGAEGTTPDDSKEGMVALDVGSDGKISFHGVVLGIMKDGEPQWFTDGIPDDYQVGENEEVVESVDGKLYKGDECVGRLDGEGFPTVYGAHEEKWVDNFVKEEFGGLEGEELQEKLRRTAESIGVEGARELLLALHAQDPEQFSAERLCEILKLHDHGLTYRHVNSMLMMKNMEHMARAAGVYKGEVSKYGVQSAVAYYDLDPMTGLPMEELFYSDPNEVIVQDSDVLIDEHQFLNDEELVERTRRGKRPPRPKATFGPDDFTVVAPEDVVEPNREGGDRWVYKVTEKETAYGPDGMAFRRAKDGSVEPVSPVEKSVEARRRYRKKTW